jgi:hypothetical protein
MHFVCGLLRMVDLPEVCNIMSNKDSEHGRAMLNFLKNIVV